jgi:hypothetical protein
LPYVVVRRGQGVGLDVIVPHPRVHEPHCRSGVQPHSVRPGEPLDSCGAVTPQCLVSLEGFWNVGGRDATQQRGQCHRVLEGLIGALSHMRQHRVGCVAKEAEPALRPPGQRLAIIEAPRECGVHVRKQAPSLWIPAGEFSCQGRRIAGS